MRRPKLSPGPEPTFVSHDVTDAKRYYLDLQPSPVAALAVVCGGVERMRPEYVVERRDFPYFALELVTEGAGTLTLKGRRFPLIPGVIFAYGPGVPHLIRNDPIRPMRKYYVDFAGMEAEPLLQTTALGQWQALTLADTHELVALFESLAREAREDGRLAKSICEALLRLLLLKIRQRALSKEGRLPRSFATYERIRLHIESHYLRLPTIDAVAKECHVTPMYVARLFRRFGRTGAYHFLLRLKMNRAAEYLLNEGLLVKETAARLGFPDAFQFSRAFKRIHGVPPARLLESRRL
ncbi:MAG TPA: AraC family transcriptional regulator [Candidatus Limnocylindria bacterium]|nr:AraC family transcriptional regulator [Candidatus Limnocylindria bacterium]